MRAASSKRAPIWWVNPWKLTAFFIFPLYFAVLLARAAWPGAVQLNVPDFVTRQEFVALGAITIVIFGAGCFLGARLKFAGTRLTPKSRINRWFLIGTGLVTVLAYVIWFGPFILTHGLRSSASAADRREELNHIAGVTSFTQLGIVFNICYAYARFRLKQKFNIAVHALFYAVAALTVLRVYLWSERVALIEVVVPSVVVVLVAGGSRRKLQFGKDHGPFVRRLGVVARRLGPVFGIPLVLVFFGVTEFFRSWTSHYQNEHQQSFAEFVAKRLLTYYYTALNNGAGVLVSSPWPAWDFQYIADWAYHFPLGIGKALTKIVGMRVSSFSEFMRLYGDPEFNNASGIFPPYHDVGIVGGFAYFLGLGLVTGMLYRAAIREQRFGILMFPVFYVACLEFLRLPYLSESRCFVMLVGLLFANTQFRTSRKPARVGAIIGAHA